MKKRNRTFLAWSMYKRLRVSAIRDYPSGCGRLAATFGIMPNVDTASSGSVKSDFSNLSKDLHKAGSSPENEAVLLGGPKLLSQNLNVANSSDNLQKAVSRRYPPPERVSAIRDYPPLCRRNVLCPSKGQKNSMGQQDLDVADKPLRKIAPTDVKEVKKNVRDGDSCNGKLMDIQSKRGSVENAAKEVRKPDGFEPSSETKLPLAKTRGKCITLPKTNYHQVELISQIVVKEQTGSAGHLQSKGTSRKEDVVYTGVRSLETKPLINTGCQHDSKGDINGLQVASDRITKLGVMPESECPRRDGKGSSKINLTGGTNESKGKKVDYFALFNRSKAAIRTKDSLNRYGKELLKKKKGSVTSEGMGQIVIWEKKDTRDPNVNVSPLGPGYLSGCDNGSNVTRNKVRETLRLFQAVSRKLLQEEEAKLKDRANTHRRIDLQAAKILKEKGKYVNTGMQILGSVPGVEVGDEFQYRVELNIVGLHRHIQDGIDYMKQYGKILATSVVASGSYADEFHNSDVLIYSGQGGNVMNSNKEPVDQKLERGNLALKKSSEEKNPVRVIRGSESVDGYKRYVYDGLYIVETYWQHRGPHGKLVFKFLLRRIPGQPELAWNEVKKSKKLKIREGLCVGDISHGKEPFPICAVNTIDDEKPPSFKYRTRMIYPDGCNPIPPEGCNCSNGCSESGICSCAVKNGGDIPFNHNGAIVLAKPLVYECGPSCKCPLTCHNRVSQHGIKFQLEIFKTKTRGWGVRSLNSIPSGSFICEYIGELLEEKEAEQRTGYDEYLFDIGNNCCNNTLWDGLSSLMPDAQSTSQGIVEDGGFTIDAAQYGNMGRFINHSCSPNLFAQNVLYDHDDQRIPHIMLFAVENIPPLQELTYDYNCMIDQVRDSDGNIKKKDCYCGSVECTGRLY